MSGALFGSPGKMIEFFPWEEKQSVDHRRSISVHDTIGGGSFAFRGKRTRRTWSLQNDDLSPDEYRDIELMLYDSQGIGPFWLIDQEARATNMLTPAQSLMGLKGELTDLAGSVSASATAVLSDGFSAPSVISGGGTIYFRPNLPVVPGEPITCSIYASGSARVVVNYTDSTGAYVSSGGTMTAVSGGGTFRRYYRNVIPPSNAAGMYFSVISATALSAPAITAGTQLLPWSVGKGCNNAVVESWSRSFDRMSSDHTDRQLVSVSLKVEEVGLGA